MPDRTEPLHRRFWITVAVLTALGLALRIAAAQGALWLDEAWSAWSAYEIRTPAAVFAHFHHDNNHHLNTLWLQMVGISAPPLLQRAFSILCGTLAIPLAALIVGRRGRSAGIIAALLFAVSPLLVNYGSEARGYAPMLLALLAALYFTARWLDDTARPVPFIPLLLAVLLGMLSQLTFALGAAALGIWVAIALFRQLPSRIAFVATLRFALPMALAGIGALALVFLPALGDGGFRFGSYTPFGWKDWLHGVSTMLAALGGGGVGIGAMVVLLLAGLAVRGQPPITGIEGYFRIAIAGVLLVPLFQIGNAGIARYYLIPAIGVLALSAIASAALLRRSGWPRGLALILLAAIALASLIADISLIASRRGDPGNAIAAMMRRAPAGARVVIESSRATAVLAVAADQARYPLRISEHPAPCPPARFLFLDGTGGDALTPQPVRCGARYAEIASGKASTLSGTDWKLYERIP